MAQLMNPEGWGAFFYHGYFATVQSSDPWFLFHVLLSPIADLSPLLIQQILLLGTFALLGSVFLVHCRALSLPSKTTSILLLILLLGNIQFMMRGFLARPAHIQSAFTLAVLVSILHRKIFLLFFLLLVSTLLSHLFVIPLLLTLCGVVWLLILRRKNHALHIAFAAFGGVGLGLWLHPHSAHYIHYLSTVFTKLPFLLQLDVGTEMMSGAGRDGTLLLACACIFLQLTIAQKKEGIRLQRILEEGIVLTTFVVITMLTAFYVWVRMIDFLWPLVLALAVQVTALQHDLPKKALQEVLPKKCCTAQFLISVLLLIFVVHTGKLANEYWKTDDERDLQPVRMAMEQIPTGSKVFNIDWDLFPLLIFLRPDLQYARGMDPGFNYLTDARSEHLFRTINTTSQPDVWLQEGLEIFQGTDSIVQWSDRHSTLLQYLQESDWMTQSDAQSVISVFLLKKKV